MTEKDAVEFVRKMEEKYDWSHGAVGMGDKARVRLPTKTELKRLMKYSSCPDCNHYLIVEFQDTSIGQLVHIKCPNCPFSENLTDFEHW